MFSHIVIFWTHADIAGAADLLVAGAEKYLRPIPGVTLFHVGRMVPSHRSVVEQSYQVALNLTFATKADQDSYQEAPLHLEFIAQCSHLWTRVVVYDFE
ncbi:MAG: Dabb family protein [Verrucomicrobiota bacterium]|nr:Dabb family protein [Verrucomicrobiota bacterium]